MMDECEKQRSDGWAYAAGYIVMVFRVKENPVTWKMTKTVNACKVLRLALDWQFIDISVDPKTDEHKKQAAYWVFYGAKEKTVNNNEVETFKRLQTFPSIMLTVYKFLGVP